MLSTLFGKRFIELEEESKAFQWKSSSLGESNYVQEGVWQKWATSCQNIIVAVFGKDSPHYQNFTKSFKDCAGFDYQIQALQGIFKSAKEDFEGGYIFNVELRVSGEIFGDFLAMAKQALSEGHKEVSAVLASAALEDTLKRYAAVNGLSVTDKSLEEVVNSLKSKGLVSGAQKSLLGTMPKFRNFAMHANWSKITEPDVSSVIGFVEQFLLSNFS